MSALRDYCVGLLDTFEPAVQAAQEGFVAQHGVYCQLPRPIDSTPVDGELTVCDWSRRHTDVPVSWQDSTIANLLPSQLPCNVWSDVWTDAAGLNWFSVSLEIVEGGRTYRYARNYTAAGVQAVVGWQEVTFDA